MDLWDADAIDRVGESQVILAAAMGSWRSSK
jgi:hypothetical protein